MKKLAIIGTTLIGSMMLCAVPLSLHFSQATVVSVALDTADVLLAEQREVRFVVVFADVLL